MNWNEILTALVKAVVVAATPFITSYVVKLLNKKAKEIQTKTDSESINLALSLLNDLINVTVVSLNQTIVEAAKKEGSFTKEKAKEVLKQAKDSVLAAATKEMKEAVGKIYNTDFDEWLTSKIEATVNELK